MNPRIDVAAALGRIRSNIIWVDNDSLEWARKRAGFIPIEKVSDRVRLEAPTGCIGFIENQIVMHIKSFILFKDFVEENVYAQLLNEIEILSDQIHEYEVMELKRMEWDYMR